MAHAQAQVPAQRKSAATKSGPDAMALLTEDHKQVKAMFKAFEILKKNDGSESEKAES